MVGQTATVYTLVTVVGQENTPTLAGNGGLSLGLPGLPSILSINPVSSPQIYAPAPICTYTSKSYPEPQAFFPINPLAYAYINSILYLIDSTLDTISLIPELSSNIDISSFGSHRESYN
jgi:hypothetical protein